MNEDIQSLPIGERLRAARTRKKISLQEAAHTTRIRSGYIEALENGRWEELPAEVYLLGFLKKYAQFLGLPAEDFLEHYNREKGVADRTPSAASAVKIEKVKKPHLQIRPAFLAALAITALIALLYISRQGISFMASPPEIKQSPVVNPEHVLSTTALRDTWVSVYSNGRRLFKGVIPAANIRIWKSRFPFQIEVRKSTDVQVEIDDKAVNLLGQEGRKTELPEKP